ncbi:MAG: SHOCT domain-containing protein [Oscillospiraceae bacterium]|nr:SHOCT domain-containing protein [Oscillospiraceae bacterium]
MARFYAYKISTVIIALSALIYAWGFSRGYGSALIKFIFLFLLTIVMALCSTNIFKYNKQGILLGIATIIFSGMQFLLSVTHISSYYLGGNTIFYLYPFIPRTIIGVIFIVMAVKYFKKSRKTSMVLPLVAIFINILFASLFYWGFGYVLTFRIFEILYIIPFLLVNLSFADKHKTPKSVIVELPLQAQKQEPVIDDLSIQLLNLKNEFESGAITQEEYDSKRKKLIGKL